MDRLIIRGEPTQLFQRITVIQDNQKTETIGVQIDTFEDIVFELLKKYNLNRIDLSGPKAYTSGLEMKIRNAGVAQYSVTDLDIRYV